MDGWAAGLVVGAGLVEGAGLDMEGGAEGGGVTVVGMAGVVTTGGGTTTVGAWDGTVAFGDICRPSAERTGFKEISDDGLPPTESVGWVRVGARLLLLGGCCSVSIV